MQYPGKCSRMEYHSINGSPSKSFIKANSDKEYGIFLLVDSFIMKNPCSLCKEIQQIMLWCQSRILTTEDPPACKVILMHPNGQSHLGGMVCDGFVTVFQDSHFFLHFYQDPTSGHDFSGICLYRLNRCITLHCRRFNV